MNVKKYINAILTQLSFDHKVFYIQTQSFCNGHVYKTHTLTIDHKTYKYKTETEMLFELVELTKKGDN